MCRLGARSLPRLQITLDNRAKLGDLDLEAALSFIRGIKGPGCIAVRIALCLGPLRLSGRISNLVPGYAAGLRLLRTAAFLVAIPSVRSSQ